MNKITRYYIAGLIDGEGYLALIPARNKNLKQPSFEPVVKIGMCGVEAKAVFTQMLPMYGGYIEKKNGHSKGGREVYTYILKSKVKVGFLMADIIDSLFIKHAQALLMLEYCALPSSHSRYKDFDAETVVRKIQIYKELKQLKQPPATTN